MRVQGPLEGLPVGAAHVLLEAEGRIERVKRLKIIRTTILRASRLKGQVQMDVDSFS